MSDLGQHYFRARYPLAELPEEFAVAPLEEREREGERGGARNNFLPILYLSLILPFPYVPSLYFYSFPLSAVSVCNDNHEAERERGQADRVMS